MCSQTARWWFLILTLHLWRLALVSTQTALYSVNPFHVGTEMWVGSYLSLRPRLAAAAAVTPSTSAAPLWPSRPASAWASHYLTRGSALLSVLFCHFGSVHPSRPQWLIRRDCSTSRQRLLAAGRCRKRKNRPNKRRWLQRSCKGIILNKLSVRWSDKCLRYVCVCLCVCEHTGGVLLCSDCAVGSDSESYCSSESLDCDSLGGERWLETLAESSERKGGGKVAIKKSELKI